MIDIHTHILPEVDDGSNSFSDSIRMIKTCLDQGINHVILTPHVLSPYMKYKFKDEIVPLFNEFKQKVDELNLGINLYLGQEISYHPRIFDFFKNDKLLSLNNSEYILLELPYIEPVEDIEELITNFSYHGYKVILAHIERFKYYNTNDLSKLKDLDVYFQINASSLNKESKNYKKTQFLLKNKLVDFISSDIHYDRENNMRNAYQFIAKHYSEEYAKQIFYENAKKIIL